MITHNWGNLFSHLVAAAVADALGERCYAETHQRLTEAPDSVKDQLKAKNRHRRCIWVCAFCVNQHSGICGSFGLRPRGGECLREWEGKCRDTVSGETFALCTCDQPKYFNNFPDECEMNKFDDMMAFLQKSSPGFAQVVAVDVGFDLFRRAWCVAELVQADSSNLEQRVQVHSREAVEASYDQLAGFDVRRCRASRPEDTALILAKIEDKDAFNEQLLQLIFAEDGLLAAWMDGQSRAMHVGRVLARILRKRIVADQQLSLELGLLPAPPKGGAG